MIRMFRELTLSSLLLAAVALVRAPWALRAPPIGPLDLHALDLAQNLRAGVGLESSLWLDGAAGALQPLVGPPVWSAVMAALLPLISTSGLQGLHVGLWGAVGVLALRRGRDIHLGHYNTVPTANLGHLLLFWIGFDPSAAASVSGIDALPLALGMGLLGLPLAEGRRGRAVEAACRVLAAGLSAPLAGVLALSAAVRLPTARDRADRARVVAELVLLSGISVLYAVEMLLARSSPGLAAPLTAGLGATLPVMLAQLGLALAPHLHPATLGGLSRVALGLGLAFGLRGAGESSQAAQAAAESARAKRAAKTFPAHAVEDQVLRLMGRAKLSRTELIAPMDIGLAAAAKSSVRMQVQVVDRHTDWARLMELSAAAPEALILLPDPIPVDWALAQSGSGSVEAELIRLEDQPEYTIALRSRTAPPPSPTRSGPVVVIGVDGADWRVMEPMIARGELPTFAALRAGGAAQLDFDTLDTTASPVIWTTIATGQRPEAHGVESYTEEVAGQGKVPITSDARRVPAVWNIASDANLNVSVINWWASWPAEPVRGRIISDHANPAAAGWMAGRYWEADAAALAALGRDTFPAALAAELQTLWVDPAAFPLDALQASAQLSPAQLQALQAAPFNERNTWSWFKTFYALDQPHAQIAVQQLQAGAPDLLMVYLRGPDPVQHYAWDTVEPLKYRVPAAHLKRDRGAVEAVYRFSDKHVGEIVAAAGPGATIIVLSDHGAEPSLDAHRSKRRDRPGGHTRDAKGVLFIMGPNVIPGQGIRGAGPLDITPTIAWLLGLPIADDLPGRVLSEAFKPELRAAQPRLRTETYGQRSRIGEAAPSAADANMLEQLRGLGYIE